MITIKKLSIIIAESALELVPDLEIKKTRKRNFSKLILDVSNHQRIIRNMNLDEKRGRPDIIHTTLLFILGSPLNLKGLIDTYIHTVNDYVIWINPETRIPKNYNRFKGLMGKLFLEGKITANTTTLLKVTKKTLRALIRDLKCDKLFVLTEKGRYIKALNLAKEIKEYTNPCVIVGGFPHGDFSREVYKLNASLISIYPESLHAWIVIAKIISSIEEVLLT